MSENNEFMNWWRNGRFGMFIHWGLYSIPAGVWKGELIPGIGEWIMFNARIPVAEYEQLAKQFYPIKFDAAKWVAVAKNAGMKYITITSKHHDGFSLFRSSTSSYNIADATPFGRDVIEELATECAKAGIKLCFYYSQSQDWDEPNGLGNTWDFVPEEEKDFQEYLDNKVKPQLRELLTQYGPVGMIWFDTPKSITNEQSLELKAFVKSIQPDCIVSGRIGNEVGDYGSLGDNQHPAGPASGDWETPCTLNDTWGYKSYDENWKSVEELLGLLVNCASKGVNYLLNVGPDQEGVIPPESVDRLSEVGAWLRVNGEAVYGTKSSPYASDLEHVGISRKGNTLYLMFKQWPGNEFTLVGLKCDVIGARLLSDARIEIPFEQAKEGDIDRLTIDLPQAHNEYFPVVALDLASEAIVDQRIIQQADGSIVLPVHVADLESDGIARVSQTGTMQNWNDPAVKLNWDFVVSRTGRYEVQLEMDMNWERSAQYGSYPVKMSVGDEGLEGIAGVVDIPDDMSGDPFITAVHVLGTVQLTSSGSVRAAITIGEAAKSAPLGFTLSTVKIRLLRNYSPQRSP